MAVTRYLRITFAEDDLARGFDLAADSTVPKYDLLLAIEKAIGTKVEKLKPGYRCPPGTTGVQVFQYDPEVEDAVS